MTIQPVVGVYGIYPVNDNISKMPANRSKLQIILTPFLVMYNLLSPLARVRLSKHYTTKTTTMYRWLRSRGTGSNIHI